jgi:hypothetical protein
MSESVNQELTHIVNEVVAEAVKESSEKAVQEPLPETNLPETNLPENNPPENAIIASIAPEFIPAITRMNTVPIQLLPVSASAVLKSYVDKNLEAVVQSVENMISSKGPSAIDIMSLCVNAMQLVEKIPGLSGREKKALVISAITKVFDDRGMDKAPLFLLPSAIDTLVSVANGQVLISLKKACCGCL